MPTRQRVNLSNLYKPIFVVGLHRTGSTLLMNVLALNAEVAMATDEMDLFNPWHRTFSDHFKSFGDLRDDGTLSRLIDFIFKGTIAGSFWRDYRTLGMDRAKILRRTATSDRSLRSVVAILLDEYGIKVEKPRVGVKYPLHFSHIDTLYKWFPDAKVVFLVRDIRAVCASKVNDEKTRERKDRFKWAAPLVHYATLLFFVMEFIWSARVYIRFRNRENFYLLRYEDLVLNSEDYVARLCRFCDIPYDDGMTRTTGKPSSHSGETTSGFDQGRIEAWKERLHTFDKWFITRLSEKSMKVFGYPTNLS